jgi:hypothetical protein
MERSKIAETICEVLYTGHAAALLASAVDEQAKWALASGASQQQPTGDPPIGAKCFQGFVGLCGLANFYRDALQIASGDMTGCVIRGGCLFAFGTIRFKAAGDKEPSETNFAGKLIWRGMQIISGEFRTCGHFLIRQYRYRLVFC